MSLPGLVLFLAAFRALMVSLFVMVLEYSSDGASGVSCGVRCSFIVLAHWSTSALCS